MPVLDAQLLIDNRVHAIRAMHDRIGNLRAQLDVSGGIDSGVMLGLLARAVGPENVTAVYSSIHSGDEFRDRARLCAAAFDVALIELDLTQIFESLTEMMQASLSASGVDLDPVRARIKNDRSVLGSLRSCLRAPIGRGYNRLTGGGIRHGTGNECEDRFLRFYQKGGDGEVDTNPLAMLGKGEVFQLARALGVPHDLIDAIPSPDLHGIGSDHNDEDELHELTGVHWTYSRIDRSSGNYNRVGSIERMSRFLDDRGSTSLLDANTLNDHDFDQLAKAAAAYFPSYSHTQIDGLLRSCRQLEAASRHKANPNIPSFGDRAELVDAGILTDSLPDLS
ncbi:MAG: NH3-dependent NAD+ synthetase [Planctomycetota bacterium]|jgi:NH3-dependent NAD+ synthetase